MRRALDALYTVSGVLAGVFLVLIALLSLAQIGGRLLGYAAYSFDEFAGYSMAASAFLGLAYTFRAGEHIRVALLIDRVGTAGRRGMEQSCLAVAFAMTAYFAWFACEMAWVSYRFGDVSQGLVAIKLWIPQSAMAGGIMVFAVALFDDLFAILSGGRPSYLTRPTAADASASERV